MSRELHIIYPSSGSPTLYCTIRQPATGKVWYVNGGDAATFEAWGTLGRDANDYDIAVTHRGGGLWTADFPSDVPAGDYTVVYCQRDGSVPADTDSPVIQDHGRWTGTRWVSTFDLLQGPGDTLVALTIRTTGGTALEGVSVWVSDQDDSATQLCNPRQTSSLGQVEFYLTLDETYYVFCGHNGYTFEAATISPVSGTVSFTLDIATVVTPSTAGEKKTCAEMISRVLGLVGRQQTTSVLPLSTIILDALNEAHRKIAERVPNAMELQVTDDTTFDAETDEYEIDLDDLEVVPWHLHRIWIVNGTETAEVRFLGKDRFRRRYPDVESCGSGLPSRWTRDGNTIRFSCPFSSDYDGLSIKIDYTKKPTRFTSISSTQTSDFNDADDGLMLWAEAKALKAIAKTNIQVLRAAAAKESEWVDWLVEYESHRDLETEENTEDYEAAFAGYEDC